VKFFPNQGLAPYVAVGGGWADYEQSATTLAGGPNPAPPTVNHGAFDYGGGWISNSGDSSDSALRFEISMLVDQPTTPHRFAAGTTTWLLVAAWF
jgi:hypothetical protein